MWEHTFALSTSLLDALGCASTEISVEGQWQPAPMLGLFVVDDPVLISKATELGLDSKLAGGVQRIYYRQMQEHADSLQQAFERDWIEMQANGGEEAGKAMTVSTLHRFYRESYWRASESSKEAVLQLLEKHCETRVTAENACMGDFTNHSLELLRAAFERNQRPSPGDRKHLAAAANLSLRQVTRWVSLCFCVHGPSC